MAPPGPSWFRVWSEGDVDFLGILKVTPGPEGPLLSLIRRPATLPPSPTPRSPSPPPPSKS
jgi:hypothetical protein